MNDLESEFNHEPVTEDLVREVAADFIRPEFIEAWLQRPAEAWGGKTPAELIANGEGRRILYGFAQMAYGVY